MARLGKGILDGFSGSIGNITGAKSKQKDIIKQKIIDPTVTHSAKQLKSRNAMRLGVDFVNNLTFDIDIPEEENFYSLINNRDAWKNLILKLSSSKTPNFFNFDMFGNSIMLPDFNIDFSVVGSVNNWEILQPFPPKWFLIPDDWQMIEFIMFDFPSVMQIICFDGDTKSVFMDYYQFHALEVNSALDLPNTSVFLFASPDFTQHTSALVYVAK